MSCTWELYLQDVGNGTLSVNRMGVYCAATPRPRPPEVAALAACRGHNGERALHRWVQQQPWGIMPQPYEFMVPKQIGRRVRPRPHFVHLPHEVFAAVAKYPDLWEYIFGSPRDFRDFWAGSASADSAVGQEWLAGVKAVWAATHPASAWDDAVERVCPVGMHGDEAGGHGHDKVLVMTWGSVAVDRPTMDSRLLFTMLKEGESAGQPTTDGIHNVLVWSLQALAAGTHPHVDEHGRAFGPGHHPERAKLAGQPLASARGFACGIFAEARGDWEYLWKSLRLVHYYRKDACCHLCSAHKKTPGLLYTDCRRASAVRGTHVSNAAWVASATSVLVRIPGFHVWRCYFDIMHTMDLGILQLVIPSALAELCSAGGLWAGPNRAARVASASADYHDWCRRARVPTQYRVKAITEAWVDGDYPQVSMVHAKAAGIRRMAQWISRKCDQASAGQHGARRAMLFRKLVQADRLLASHGRFLAPAAADSYATLVETALAVYGQLAAEAQASGTRLWPVTPKFHALQHIAYDQARMGNPRRVHCYSDEDMVGKMKRIYIRCHGTTAPQRGLQRYALLQNMRWRARAQASAAIAPVADAASAAALPTGPPLPLADDPHAASAAADAPAAAISATLPAPAAASAAGHRPRGAMLALLPSMRGRCAMVNTLKRAATARQGRAKLLRTGARS